MAIPSVSRAQDFVIGASEAAERPLEDLSRKYSFSIPRQSLDTALTAYTDATGIQIIYDAPVSTHRTSPGVQGSLNARQALEQLIDGTDLTPRALYSGAYSLAPTVHGAVYGVVTPNNAPTLKLNMGHAQEAADHTHLLYAMSVELAIRSALQHNLDAQLSRYQARIIVWLSPLGAVSQSSLLNSTGSPSLDATITKVVQNVSVGSSPPSGLPQPIFVRVLTKTDR
jgi:TonB family protein